MSTETHTQDQQIVEQEKSDTQTVKQSAPTETEHEHKLVDRKESYDSFITDTTISTSSDTNSLATESASDRKDNQEATSAESLLSEIPVRFNFRK